MAACATRSASNAASSSSTARPTDAMFAEPHEYRNEERMLISLLDEMRRGRLPAQLLPAIRSLHTTVSADPSRRCHLLSLSHDALGVIFDGLADPLQPELAVAFSSTCKGLRMPLRAALQLLKGRHRRALALCRKFKMSCAELRSEDKLQGVGRLVADDAATLAMILQTNGLPRLRDLFLSCNGFYDASVRVLCECLGRGAAPSLFRLSLAHNNFGPAGAEALAAALGRGAMPKLERLRIGDNPIGDLGVAALVAPLRKMPALQNVDLAHCGIGDEGVASLVANLGEDDFKKLKQLDLENNLISDVGCAKLIAALKAGALPALVGLFDLDEADRISLHASEAACAALDAALEKRFAEREAEAAPQ